jgi:hypothetical protein
MTESDKARLELYKIVLNSKEGSMGASEYKDGMQGMFNKDFFAIYEKPIKGFNQKGEYAKVALKILHVFEAAKGKCYKAFIVPCEKIRDLVKESNKDHPKIFIHRLIIDAKLLLLIIDSIPGSCYFVIYPDDPELPYLTITNNTDCAVLNALKYADDEYLENNPDFASDVLNVYWGGEVPSCVNCVED